MTFAQLIEGPPLPDPVSVIQVGWIGHQNGTFYPWDQPPYGVEPGGFTPCYIRQNED